MSELYMLERPDFYDEQSNSLNPLRRWFHRTRHSNVRHLVEKYASKQSIVADIGCGNVVWNHDGQFKVVGIDINPEALQYNLERGRIVRGIVASVDSLTDLEDEAVDLVVCSEVIEHVPNFWSVIEEAYRILKPGGYFIATVPHDTTLSLWGPLFWLQCLYQGYIRQDEYYKQKCGHVNYFSPRTILMYLKASRFQLVEQFNMKRFTIFTVVQKETND
ncbi:hypothetical protein LCGC14_1312060 [marine sediment metagenome]|uniref:Methyltransferase type 11 domain-containing protein n=1 Tax=marine sediment metagenome TaxID=412755 RepID=A0A0F9L719_9ZZZZ